MRERLILVALLLVCAGPAPAETPLLEACLGASDSRAGDLACRDLVFDACQERGDDSTAGMAQCMAEEQALWDRQLNALWPEVRAMATETGEAEADPEQALTEAQRLWIAYRDAECEWELRRQGGSIRAILVAACLRDLTAERVADFRDWLRDADPQ